MLVSNIGMFDEAGVRGLAGDKHYWAR